METYRIVRFFRTGKEKEIVKTGLTLEEAKEHCTNVLTSGYGWFDGYVEE